MTKHRTFPSAHPLSAQSMSRGGTNRSSTPRSGARWIAATITLASIVTGAFGLDTATASAATKAEVRNAAKPKGPGRTTSAPRVPSTTASANPVSTSTTVSRNKNGFSLTSSAMTNGGAMPIRFTCDGTSTAPSLQWSGAPAGTVSYAVVMHHVAGPGDVHWYWVLYGLAADVTQIGEGTVVSGTLGTNSVNAKNEYAPPCSKGPGQKAYTYTVYALSKAPTFPAASAVNRDALLAAIASTTLGSASMTVTHERSGTSTATSAPAPAPKAT